MPPDSPNSKLPEQQTSAPNASTGNKPSRLWRLLLWVLLCIFGAVNLVVCFFWAFSYAFPLPLDGSSYMPKVIVEALAMWIAVPLVIYVVVYLIKPIRKNFKIIAVAVLVAWVISAFAGLAKISRTAENMAMKTGLGNANFHALSDIYEKPSAAFSKNVDAFFLVEGGWLKTAIKSPEALANARDRIAKLKIENKQLNTLATSLLDEMNKRLAQQDSPPGVPLEMLAGYRESFSKALPNMQVQYEFYDKIFTCLDQVLADLQASPLKWKRDSDGNLIFLDEEFRAKVTRELDECRTVMKQSINQLS